VSLRDYTIGLARAGDLPKLQPIERAALGLFPPGLIPDVEGGDTSLEELRSAQERGRLFVARDARGEPVGFALVELLASGPHLEEIDVQPDHGRRGIGSALVRHVQRWAREDGHRALTLITFRDVPFNQPFYERLGFRALAPAEIPPELDEIAREEGERGFDRARRVAMRCALAGSGRAARADP
jgi:GNAT superfamily N-acetyltransferase